MIFPRPALCFFHGASMPLLRGTQGNVIARHEAIPQLSSRTRGYVSAKDPYNEFASSCLLASNRGHPTLYG